jgi:hypothetical protein
MKKIFNRKEEEFTSKVCPLRVIAQTISSVRLSYTDAICLDEKCAWYDSVSGCCALLAISRLGSQGSLEVADKERRGGR